ncbi:shikimate dehydrogenase [Sphingomonas sp. BN140010]|uniref:Shikimate dehydrogenase n=1 Tax=Sphingomonas arvum TaxID=2992113 RepID=A0ABT3JF81_9SPHN|nr:shikimate dehydrogenase [Sphingomonas sp. BN140010]MCW3797738.1 shikimate dehydrogenase [Sphingomonas sp. BN140010]
MIAYAEVIGDPVAHSRSPTIHRFWLDKSGLQGEYRREQVTPADLSRYLHERKRDPAWRGCNVTMPLKTEVVPHAGRLGAEAQRLHAGNLLFPEGDGSLRLENTDVQGVAEPLRRLGRLPHADQVTTYVQVIGSGGAARGAVLGAGLAGYGDFQIFCRNRSAGLEVAAMTGTPSANCHPLEAIGPIRPNGELDLHRLSHVIINATPMGMAGQPDVPVDLTSYGPDTIVFDMVYSPLETGFLRQARALGLRVIDGLDMLIGQAAPSFEAFFGHPAPREHDPELRERLTA